MMVARLPAQSSSTRMLPGGASRRLVGRSSGKTSMPRSADPSPEQREKLEQYIARAEQRCARTNLASADDRLALAFRLVLLANELSNVRLEGSLGDLTGSDADLFARRCFEAAFAGHWQGVESLLVTAATLAADQQSAVLKVLGEAGWRLYTGARRGEADAAATPGGTQSTDRRETLWLKWYEAHGEPTYRSFKKVRDRWNALAEAERKQLSPDSWCLIPGEGKAATDVVREAIARARRRGGS